MNRITIAPIVEGRGDTVAVRILLYRVWVELLGGEHAEILSPIRRNRGTFLKPEDQDVERSVHLAWLKLSQVGGGLILILIDAEDDCRRLGSLGPQILRRATAARNDADISCVIANVMYETWFVAAAESLTKYLSLGNVEIPDDPEASGTGKGWIKQHIISSKYSETADQPRLTSELDLSLCRRRSKSFDKLCRELELRRQRA